MSSIESQEITSTLRTRGSRDILIVIVAAAFGLTALVASILGASLLPLRFAGYIPYVPIAAVATTAIGIFYLFRPKWLELSLLLGAMTIHPVLEETYLPLGFMKLYIQDVLFAAIATLIVLRTFYGRTTFRQIRFSKYVLLFFLMGIWGAANGFLVSKHAYDEVLGDFRRAFFYFMNYFAVILLVDNLAETRRLRKVILAGCLIIMANGLFQFLSGKFYTRRFGDAAHILTHYELTFMSFAIYYGAARLLYREGRHRWSWLGIIALGFILTVVGNYRASWLGLVGGLGFMFLFLPMQKKLVLVGTGFIAAIFLAIAVYAMWDVQVVETRSTLGKELMSKANIQNTANDVNVIWRFQFYEAALEKWAERPLLGNGLGTYLSLQVATSTGSAMLTEGHNIHNSDLWLLMVFGVLGIIPILVVHVVYFTTVGLYVHHTKWIEGKITVLACGAYYASMMVATAFENFLENATPIIVFSGLVALTMLTIYHTPEELRGTPPVRA